MAAQLTHSDPQRTGQETCWRGTSEVAKWSSTGGTRLFPFAFPKEHGQEVQGTLSALLSDASFSHYTEGVKGV